MWLSAEVLDWQVESGGGGKLGDEQRVARPYELLGHATQLVQSADSNFARVDALSNLKRSINVRLQHIEDLYRFGELFPKGVGALERLELVGLAKPFLIKLLFELRNDVEHNDTDPPDSNRLRELIDMTWYFLKATDPACKVIPYSVELSCNSGSLARHPSLGMTAHLSPGRPKTIDIAGWVSTSLMHDTPALGLLELQLKECRERPNSPISEEPIDLFAFVHNSARREDERWIEGYLSVHWQHLQKLWKSAFEAK